MNNCIFCLIAQHKKDAHIIWEDDYVIAFLDTDPISDGHTLIIPKNNIKDFQLLDDITTTRIMTVAKIIAGAIGKLFRYDGISIMSVSGLFQDIPHFHLHVFGRNLNNDITINYPTGAKKKPEQLMHNANLIKNNIKKASDHL